MTRVLILARSALARAGLENLLPRGRYDVVGSVADLEALEEVFADSEPEIVLVDAGFDSRSELLAAISASEIARDSVVIFLADHPPPSWSAEALGAGARSVLPADVSSAQLCAAIDAALEGLLVLHPEETSPLLTAPATQRSAATPSRSAASDELPEPLTRREREVLQMLAGGLANKEIAAKLNLSEHTVKFHVASILGKLGAASRTEAVSIALRRALILL